MNRSFALISADAAHKLATRTRNAFMTGEMGHDEFRYRRARQEIVAHNRFETILARMYPGHKPDFVVAVVNADGTIATGRDHQAMGLEAAE